MNKRVWVIRWDENGAENNITVCKDEPTALGIVIEELIRMHDDTELLIKNIKTLLRDYYISDFVYLSEEEVL